MQRLMDAQKVAEVIGGLAEKVLADKTFGGIFASTTALVGIRSRGEILAGRVASEIEKQWGVKLPVGALDITMYRDDLATRRAITVPQGTEMNFRLDGLAVILIDDVLETGRSVRAALDAIVDFGRPRMIRVMTLVERGGREYPIAGDYAGIQLGADPRHRVVVKLRPKDEEDGVYLEEKLEVQKLEVRS